LIVSQVGYPGWSATINGDGADINTHDDVLMSLTVPAGAQSIDLTFRPQRWTLYLTVAAISAVAWMAALGFTLARGRRRSIVSA
jgi:uncharacterized membrane protein YfhO